jgi:hypothetical protein
LTGTDPPKCGCFDGPEDDGHARVAGIGQAMATCFAMNYRHNELCPDALDYTTAVALYAVAVSSWSLRATFEGADPVRLTEQQMCEGAATELERLLARARDYAAARTAQAERPEGGMVQ